MTIQKVQTKVSILSLSRLPRLLLRLYNFFIIPHSASFSRPLPSGSSFETGPTVRSKVLIMLAFIRTSKLLEFPEAHHVRLHHAPLKLSLQTMLLPGVWQILTDAVLSMENGEGALLWLFFLIGWSVWVPYPIAYVSVTDKRIHE